jgi:DnaK suppressor protein
VANEPYDQIKATLTDELASVERQLAEHGFSPEGDALQVEVDEGFADSAAATTERASAIALAEQLSSHRSDILKALERIEAGTYGKCERCGNEIPVERLEAIPTATLCVSCKQLAG